MKKLFGRLAALAAATLVPILVLNPFYRGTEHYKTENGVMGFERVPSGLALANTGSSHGKYGFRYDRLSGAAGFNFAMEGQPFVYDLALLRHFADRLNSNAVVLISVSIESFHRIPESTPEIRPRYYRILPRHLVPDYCMADEVRYSLLPVLGAGRNVFRIFDDRPAADDGAFRRSSLAACTGEDLERLAQERYKDVQVVVVRPADGEALRRNERLLEEMIRFCQASQWTPVLVSTPFARAFGRQYSEEDWIEFQARIEAVRAVTGGPAYFDHSRDGRFADAPELFSDVDHLNESGAEQFTAVVVGELQKGGVLPSAP